MYPWLIESSGLSTRSLVHRLTQRTAPEEHSLFLKSLHTFYGQPIAMSISMSLLACLNMSGWKASQDGFTNQSTHRALALTLSALDWAAAQLHQNSNSDN